MASQTTDDQMARPQVQRNTTTPNLVGYLNRERGPDDDALSKHHEHQSAAERLLQQYHDRNNEDYRRIVFDTPLRKNEAYASRLAFDTIDNRYDDEELQDESEEEFKREIMTARMRLQAEADARSRGREREFLRSPATSPNGSPTRMRSPNARYYTQIKYPTTPITTCKTTTATRVHKDFEDLYWDKLATKGLRPILPGRVILVYISGRVHSWVALDWILHSFIEHGDTVIIVSSISHALGPPRSRLKRYPSPTNFRPMTEKVRQRQRNRPEFIKEIAANVMDYALTVINPDIIAKVVVEIAQGKTRDVLEDMYKLYEPNIACTSTKTNHRNSAPLKSWYSSRISDRLVKNFPLPVIVVPACNMGNYEKRLSSQLSVGRQPSLRSSRSFTSKKSELKSDEKESSKKTSELDSDSDDISLSDASLRSDASTDSEASGGSYTSFDEIAELHDEYTSKLTTKLNKLEEAPVDENYFSNFAKAISDSSLHFCEELRDINPDFKGKGARLARAITGSNSFGAVPYKTKSLLPPVEKAVSPGTTPAMSYSELKKNLKLNAQKAQEQANPPTIQIDSPDGSNSSTPKPSALKFDEGEKVSRRTRSKPLQKFLSNDEPSGRKVKLEPLKSHPDIKYVDDGEDRKKKKKKRFWKLF